MKYIFMWMGLVMGFGFSAVAQSKQVRGKLIDQKEKTPISGATIKLTSPMDSSLSLQTISNAQGGFQLEGNFPDSIQLQVSSVGYEKRSLQKNLTAGLNIISISLNRVGKQLQDVTVVAQTPPTTQKGDTVQYSANQFKVNPDATGEDLIKKMPGITVDKAGTVTAQGEQVKKVTVDGREYFGDDATAALRNLPAEVIDKIQVFDRLSDQAAFTGFDDGNSSKAINIVTKANMRNGQYGRVYAGAGTEGRYNAGGNVTFSKEKRRISLIGLFNNINQQNFASQDLLGVSSSQGGGGRGGRGGQGGNGGSNFLVGQQSGITGTNAAGINYSDTWSKKLQVTGSYFFNNSNNSNNQVSAIQNLLRDGSYQNNDENTLSASNNYNHRINLRFEYKINDRNTIIFTPTASFQNNNSNTDDSISIYKTPAQLISESITRSNKNSNGFNIGNNLLWRHNFAKKGRTISVNLNANFNKNDGETYQLSNNNYYFNSISDSLQQLTNKQTNGNQLGANISYTEPVGKKGQLQINYNPSLSNNKADQGVYKYDYSTGKYASFDTSISNRFDNTVTTHNVGVTYRLGDRDNMFSIGLAYQNTALHSDQVFPLTTTVDKSFNNLLPNLIWRKKINTKSTIRIFYRSSTNAPSVTQLQNVFNNVNPLLITTGNPNLKQQTGNTVSARYTYTNTAKGKSFFANLFLQQNSDYITNASFIATADSQLTPTVTLYRGSQLSSPVNLDGYLSLRSFFTYGMPLKFIKSNVNFNAGFTWAKTPGLVNKVESITNSYNYNTGVVVASNISEYVDFNVSYSAAFNVVDNSLQSSLNNNYVNQSAGVQLNLLNKNGWFVQNDVSYQAYSGLSDGFNQSYWLWNAAIGKKFLKKQAAELKLSVFDLLKQNQSITRTVTETYISDVRNDVLQQYFLLTFSYKLKNFGVAAAGSNNGPSRQGMMRPGGMNSSF